MSTEERHSNLSSVTEYNAKGNLIFKIKKKKGNKVMKHFLFKCTKVYSDNEGEFFLVGGATIGEAQMIATEEFGEARLICEMTEEEAENSGLDEW